MVHEEECGEYHDQGDEQWKEPAGKLIDSAPSVFDQKEKKHPTKYHHCLTPERETPEENCLKQGCQHGDCDAIVMGAEYHSGVLPEAVESGTDDTSLLLFNLQEKIIQRDLPECFSIA